MKKKITFMVMLFLLVSGITDGWAYTYTVNYSGRTQAQGAGYTLVEGQTVIDASNSSQTSIVTNGSNDANQINAQNYSNYFTPNQIEGYVVSVTASNSIFNRSITITYTLVTNKTYRMIFESEMLSEAGYTVNDAYKGDGTGGLKITSADDAEFLVFEGTSSTLPNITANNISTYITARQISGYTQSYYIDTNDAELGYTAIISINYETTATVTDPTYTWNDGVYEYSRIYTRQTGTTVLLPEDEVAIRLYLNHTETVTDTIVETNRLWGNNNTQVGAQQTINGITYTYLGSHTNGFGGGTYFYARTHTVTNSTLTNAVIPREVTHDGKTYKVTAIQKWGFCYEQNDQMMVSSGTPNNCNQTYFWGCINDHSNWYLKSVTFEYPSNVKSIGDYAFMSCVKLKTAVFPSSIEYMGQGIFEMDEALTDMRFETITANDLKADEGSDMIGKVRFEAIRNFTFWLCVSLNTLELPDGITIIEGKQAGAAMQYMLSLINVRLPNTLKFVGPHFLCCAKSLKTLTIPASVVYIDGACFHGCESLENVYLLGSAASLQREAGSSTTFGDNATFCADPVEYCTFWTTQDYYDSYHDDPVWHLIDQDGNTNWLKYIPEEEREFVAGRWVTAIFPHEIPDAYAALDAYDDLNQYTHQDKVKNGFGEGTRVAVMKSAKATNGTDPKTGKPITIYDITFQLLQPTNGNLVIPQDTPVLLCPGEDGTHLMATFEDMQSDEFKERMSVEYTSWVNPTNDEYNSCVEMKGMYTGHQLRPWDYYFMYERTSTTDPSSKEYDSPAKFWRVDTQSSAPNIKAYRCWWTLTLNGARTDGQATTSQGAKFFNNFEEDEATGINTVEEKDVVIRVGIYDLNGRKLNVSADELPQGIFIVNGKKVVVR